MKPTVSCGILPCLQVVGTSAKSKHHYIWGWPLYPLDSEYIGEKNLSQKCGDLRCIEIIPRTAKLQIAWFRVVRSKKDCTGRIRWPSIFDTISNLCNFDKLSVRGPESGPLDKSFQPTQTIDHVAATKANAKMVKSVAVQRSWKQ